jgi:hypothetical protein
MKHLSDEEIFELLAAGEAAPNHLKECAACRAHYGELSDFVAAAAQASGPEPDWDAQRRAVMAAVSRPRRSRLWLGAALAAGLLLAVGVSYLAGLGQGPRQEVAGDVYAQQGLALLEWRPGEPLGEEGEEFDGFIEFMVPMPEEDNNDETIGGTGLHGYGAPAGGPGLA